MCPLSGEIKVGKGGLGLAKQEEAARLWMEYSSFQRKSLWVS